MRPTSEAIRGGTDGSRLTERGLPTPNIFTGFHNVHSQLEWVSLQDMAKAAEVVVRLAQLWEERA
jgi:tripeptide aminopeptidase